MTVDELPKGQLLENVVAACERILGTVPGTEVIQRAMLPVLAHPEDEHEIDVLVLVRTGPRELRIGVEVKDWKRPLGMRDLGAIIEVKDAVGLDVVSVVCSSGFASGAERKARVHNVSLVTPEAVEHTGALAASPGDLVREKGVRFTHVQYNVDPRTSAERLAELREGLARAKVWDVQVQLPNGQWARFDSLVTRHLMDDLRREPPPDGARYNAEIVFPRGLVVDARVGERRIPPPTGATVDFECVDRPVADRRFRLLGVDVVTFLTTERGVQQQTTMAMIPAEEGGFRVAVARGIARPQRTRLR